MKRIPTTILWVPKTAKSFGTEHLFKSVVGNSVGPSSPGVLVAHPAHNDEFALQRRPGYRPGNQDSGHPHDIALR